MKNKFEINNIINRIRKGGNTFFLDNKKIKYLSKILDHDNIDYNIFYPFKDATYGIIYKDKLNVKLLKINTKEVLTHSSIMGSLFSLNIKNDVIGDIIIGDNYYVLVIDHMADYIINNIYQIGNKNVALEEVDINIIKDYEIKYKILSTTVSSLRIDTVLSKIVGDSRKGIIERIKNKEVILNYDVLNKNDYVLKENDVFSIRRSGKYKFNKIVGISKRDKYIIEYLKYIG